MLVPLIPIAVVCSVGFIASIVKLIGNKRDKAVVGLQHEQTRRLESTLFINNIEYVFLHSPDRAGIQDAAIEFCSLKGSEMGVTVQNFKDCVNPIVTSLHRKYNGLETENVTLGPTIWERHQLTGQGTESQTSVTEQQPDPQTKQTTTEFPTDLTLMAASHKLAKEFCDSKQDLLGLPLKHPPDDPANSLIIENMCTIPLSQALAGEAGKVLAS